MQILNLCRPACNYSNSKTLLNTINKCNFQYCAIYNRLIYFFRQCMCCFKDVRNYKRFNIMVHSLLLTLLKVLNKMIKDQKQEKVDVNIESKEESNKKFDEEIWDTTDAEMLFLFVPKVFEINFPLYMAYKHSVHSKIEEVSQDEATKLNNFCDVNDPDVPVYLFRNVCFFCEKEGIELMSAFFKEAKPETLPVTLAHALVSVIANIKLYLNMNSIVKLLVEFRKNVIKYMCLFTDKDLRTTTTKNTLESLWSIVKDPLDAHLTFDKDGLDLAFKYFTSTTLTTRLSGIAQINNHINMYNELCNNDNYMDPDSIGSNLTAWLIQNKIIEHIFGPNLHVEIIKQSHIVLNFLAMESKITNEHIDCIWCAAQLKHCSRQVHELLPSLIKNMDTQPVVYLYKLLFKLEPQAHTEQTLFLASALIKFIWSNGNSPNLRGNSHVVSLADRPCDAASFPAILSSGLGVTKHDVSSSENSISIEASEDELSGRPHQNNSENDCNQLSERQNSSCGEEDEPEDEDDEESGDSDDQSDQSISQDRIIVDVENSQSDEEKKKNTKSSQDKVSCEAQLQPAEYSESKNSKESAPVSHNEACSNNIKSDKDHERQKNIKRKKKLRKSDSGVKVRRMVELNNKEKSGESRIDVSDHKSSKLSRRLQGELDELPPLDATNPPGNMEVSIYECRPYLQHLSNSRQLNIDSDALGDILSPDDGRSCNSSKLSNKSEKNMADFDGEEDDSGCDEELVHLAAQGHLGPHHMQQHLANMNINSSVYGIHHNKLTHQRSSQREYSHHFDIATVCEPGHTLLWDILQDDKIFSLSSNIAAEAERVLCTLVCWANDRRIKMKFIEGCLRNLANNRSVVISLKLLTKLFNSFQHFRGRPDTHSITLVQQVDELWSCLATDAECADELFNWMLKQANNKDHHAMKDETFRHIFLEKMPLLEPENFSMTAISLFQHLSEYGRIIELNSDNDKKFSDSDARAINQLWGIVLKAKNTDVSMTAMHFLNNYYISVDHGNLSKEEEFINQCMESLCSALKNISKAEELNLTIIQRGLLLLRTHLEAFKRRFAYHLRHWQLKGKGIFSHRSDKPSSPIRLICQPAGLSDKVSIVLGSSDYIADLRAEVTVWWDQLQDQNKKLCSEAEDNISSANLTPILGSMLADGPIRMISQGQELTTDFDEKTLEEMSFKDLQLVFVSVGAARPYRKREGLEPASLMSPPAGEKVPMNILLQPYYFEQLFDLMQQLSALKSDNKHGEAVPHTKGQILSRRVWETLTMLPTSPAILEGFLNLSKKKENDDTVVVNSYSSVLQKLLNPESPQKLLYSLQVIESLCKSSSKSSMSSTSSNFQSPTQSISCDWTDQFLECGGLRHLFDIFSSGILEMREGFGWDEWNQDCLEFLLKIIYHLGVEASQVDLCHDDVFIENYDPPKKKSKRNRKSHDKLLVPTFNKLPFPADPNQYKTGFWSRAQVVHNTFSILISWYFSSESVRSSLFNTPDLTECLKKLILDHPEPSVRREACNGLHKLCLGSTTDGQSGRSCIPLLLSHLLSFISVAQVMRPASVEHDEEKEPYGPSCKDYFWLVWHLVDQLDDDFKDLPEQKSLLNLDNLERFVAQDILKRDFYETRHYTITDDGLIGLLTLCTVILKRNVPFKFSKEGQEFLSEIFECLFALPCPEKRYLPKCKSQSSRSWGYDLLVELVRGSFDNYQVLHDKLLHQHSAKSHAPYPWDYWPHEDGRSDCGYVGLTNLGATCYMASCMQHLYMLPQARETILSAKESERKAYNPRSFCKVYTMDHQPLNTGEQKDMAEFFTDLISKLEDMNPQLKDLVKNLFCGVTSNNVVSLDCPHISRTIEEFYTVRCQVLDVRSLYESLNETTVKDTLEGDNMYTCSQCEVKVRAEKRACFKKLPKILCFNTMRYQFDMRTMSKEKVNTLFSFPMRLDMSNYMEKHLMPDTHSGCMIPDDSESDSSFEYDLIGITVHTGTADGGHYYSFIRERLNPSGKDKWFSFNDAEVKYFDPSKIDSECFGGELMVRSDAYDSVSDKFMDFSLEKTNSAYMLFYERIPAEQASSSKEMNAQSESIWIWRDNMQFLQDKSIFEHTYFNFMWQICGIIPQTLTKHPEITLMSAKLSTSFVLETLIHAKEKPTMVQWIELLTKQFNASQSACEWFMEHMAEDDWWPVQILIKCPNQVVRQMFQRLCIHVINKLKPLRAGVFLRHIQQVGRAVSRDGNCPRKSADLISFGCFCELSKFEEKIFSGVSDDSCDVDFSQIEHYSCVTRFVKKLLTLIEHGAKQHLKHLTEYFAFLYEFAKMGDEEGQFLLSIDAISIMINFYLGQKNTEFLFLMRMTKKMKVISVAEDKYKPASLDKMISLIAMLVEKSRGNDDHLHLSENDLEYHCTWSKGWKNKIGFPFLFQQIKDNINIRQTCNLIVSLCKFDDAMSLQIVNMIFTAITKHNEANPPFFKLLSMLVDYINGPPGVPSFAAVILKGIWEIFPHCPQQCLEWLAAQVPRNKIAHSCVIHNMDNWVETYLVAHSVQRVRNAAAFLLVSVVPSPHFRQAYRTARSILSPIKEMPVNTSIHGTNKLTAYFSLMTYFLIGRAEKLMFAPYFVDLWQLFQPKLSEPPIPVHQNKQSLLIFWYNVSCDCIENIKLIITNPHVTKNIAFNYILADHDQQDVILFNRCMLPAYYGLLRLCCQHSKQFTRLLANHQNIQWAFKHITPYATHYGGAVDELLKLMRLFIAKGPDSSEQELNEILNFKRTTLKLFIEVLDPRSSWTTLISVFQILIESNEDKIFVIVKNGLSLMFEAFHMLHIMYHEATACHITGELVELLSLILDILKCLRLSKENTEVREWLIHWKEVNDYIHKLLTLLNSFTPNDVRKICVDVLKELVLLNPVESLQLIVPLLSQTHSTFHENNCPVSSGPYFPHRGQKTTIVKSSLRPQRPLLQMLLHPSQIEASKGVDEEYDQALRDFFLPYHQFVDMLCRVAINYDCVTEMLVNLSVLVGCEAVHLHFALFPKLWLDVYNSEQVDRSYLRLLYNSNYISEYMEMVLIDERLSVTSPVIFHFMSTFLPKVSDKVLTHQPFPLVETLVSSIISRCKEPDLSTVVYRIISDLRVLSLLFMLQPPTELNKELEPQLVNLSNRLSLLFRPEYEKRCLEVDEQNKSCGEPSGDQASTSNESESSSSVNSNHQNKEAARSSSNAASGDIQSNCLSHPLWVDILSKTITDFLSCIDKS
ncbi:Ubiquitin carboxyl-terminal hydrolase 34 [Nymphon striatum]|nr:Ubiquitin carboxyl-terminal hydrolase 34 [Nymphon striatum]